MVVFVVAAVVIAAGCILHIAGLEILAGHTPGCIAGYSLGCTADRSLDCIGHILAGRILVEHHILVDRIVGSLRHIPDLAVGSLRIAGIVVGMIERLAESCWHQEQKLVDDLAVSCHRSS